MVECIRIGKVFSNGTIESPGTAVCLPLRTYNTSRLAVTQIQGLNPMPGSINMDDNAGSDGSIFNSARAQSRQIVITLKPFDSDCYDFNGNYIKNTMEATRRKVYSIFPLKKKIRLYIETETRKFYIDGFTETIESDYFGDMEGMQVTIMCPDPYFKTLYDSPSYECSESGVIYEIISNFISVKDQLQLDHDIPVEISMVFSTSVNSDSNDNIITLEWGTDKSKMTAMTISNLKFNAGDEIRINTKNRSVYWYGYLPENDSRGYILTTDSAIDETKTYYIYEDGRYVRVSTPVASDLYKYYEFVKVKSNIISYVSFNQKTPIDNFEYYLPGENPTNPDELIGNHRLIFNKWFTMDKDLQTYFRFIATTGIIYNYTLTTDTVVDPSKTYYILDGTNYVEVLYPQQEDLPSYYERSIGSLGRQFLDSVIVKPILEYEGV